MKYELAKQLKDAGFKSGIRGMFCCPCMDYTVEKHGSWVCQHKLEDEIYVPTLSKLIEACGKDFGELRRQPDREYAEWFVYNYPATWSYCAKTPEEAVANLWLQLNEKR